MKFKVGDTVTVRKWDDMAKEFEVSDDNIKTPMCLFVEEMKPLCGKKVTIAKVLEYSYRINEDGCSWSWTDEMFEEAKPENNKPHKLGNYYFPIECYNRNNKTIIKLPNGKMGVAKCDPKDEFSEGIGVLFATARAYGLDLNEVAKLCEKKEPRKIAEVGDYVKVVKTRLDLDPETVLHIKENGIALVQNGKWKDWFYPFSDNYFPDYKILTSEEVEEFKKKHKESK